ncbi:hypothetical protein [Leptospira sarikeiensis]|uniref:Uncharacterized protein n=1 Tax=Leptospira sarikeiensis TaxID=2484943 RepID=A0A4R9K582_9LEPT|nr:hypothetical protein [Leptospira sarikeiensis]TGL59508.1 hypothetical protein EHQ64_15555 [Leptospira sarikeiensis]
MKGIVEAISKINGFLAVKTEFGEYSIVEVLSGISIEVGDKISGNLESLGGEDLLHESGEVFGGFIQDYHCDQQRAVFLLKQK